MKWLGAFENLKVLLEELIGLRGKWSSPSGRAKKFTCEMCDSQVSITWYCGKQCSLVFGGNMASELKGQFIRIAANEMEETTIGDQRRTATNTHDGTSSPVNIFEDSLNELSER